MKPRSIFFNIHINDTVTKDPQKRYVLLNYQRKLSREKSHNFFVTFPIQQYFSTKYFTRKTHFSKQKLKSSYR